jgi:ribulose-bisphosphate carboxylase large chain
MCGGNALLVGTLGAGKMTGNAVEDGYSLDECLRKDKRFKTMMPVCSGGIYPGVIAGMIKSSGLNVQIQAGGGVAGHPGGVRKGAMGMCQAVDAAFLGIDVKTYAKAHPELKTALDLWGIK